MALDVHHHDDADGIRLEVRGDVDITTGARLEDALRDAERDAPAVVTLDLRGVDFFDSTGLQIVLDADLRAQERGSRLVVAAGDSEAARVLELAQVLERLNVVVLD